jgi:hypothetical protein
MTRPLLFTGFDQNGDDNLWVTDGTAAGTSEISVAGVASEGLFGPDPIPYFAALPGGRNGIDAKGDFNLWVTNGTAAGTSEISLTNKQDPGGFNPQFMTAFGSKVLLETPSTMAICGSPMARWLEPPSLPSTANTCKASFPEI